jgi:IS30 family transposase
LKTHKKLTSAERILLAAWKKEGLSNIICAKRLRRAVSTIGRELKRNRIRVSIGNKTQDYIYEPNHAQFVSESKKQNAWLAKQPLKNKKIYAYVLEKLKESWSPEQIAGRLRKIDHPDDPSWHICMETIYQFIYKEKSDKTKLGIKQESILNKKLKGRERQIVTVTDNEKPLYEYLRRKQKKRRKLNGRKVHRVRIPDRISIHDRPKEIDERKQFGHWEGDSIVGLAHKNGLHTEYERIASLTRFERLYRISSAEMVRAAKEIFGNYPKNARRSTTLDNGSEHVKHTVLNTELEMQTYFADPYSSWQRGGNENCNLWIRYYFPKGTDFDKISDEELRDVEWELNNRPRKRLNFKTPQEVFNEHLNILP